MNIVRGSKCPLFKVVLSGKDNFRERIATIKPYKENRKGQDKPHHFNLLRDWLLEKPYTIVSVDEEADDVISRAMIAGHVGASPDKDLNNTPGSHYNFRTGELYEVSEAEARRNFYTQMLVGDTADNIPGIKGVGPKTAAKLLLNCKIEMDYEGVIYREYNKIYPDPTAAMNEVGQLLWMSRVEGEHYSYGN
jgi:DNA polymerase-1